MTRIPNLGLALPFLALALASSGARAETTQCIEITSVPVVLSTQGVYCMTQDLATAINSGAAITVDTNNVTIDCNGRRLGGLGGGPASMANGVLSLGRSNITVRGCRIRGFRNGVLLSGLGGPDASQSGIVVEDNQLDGNLRTGITVVADGSIVRRNSVTATGTSEPITLAAGIQVANGVDVLDNTVDGVTGVGGPGGGSQLKAGIIASANERGVIGGNTVRRIVGGSTFGILLSNPSAGVVAGNILMNANPAIGNVGISCGGQGLVRDNLLNGYDFGAIQDCTSLDNTIVN